VTPRRLALWKDDLFLAHNTGRHPECADRLRAVHVKLEDSPIWPSLDVQPLAKIDRALVERVHPPLMLKAIEAMSQVRRGGPHCSCVCGGGC
jgi:acetoin utilization deacetylase AcuC-like enzyme